MIQMGQSHILTSNWSPGLLTTRLFTFCYFVWNPTHDLSNSDNMSSEEIFEKPNKSRPHSASKASTTHISTHSHSNSKMDTSRPRSTSKVSGSTSPPPATSKISSKNETLHPIESVALSMNTEKDSNRNTSELPTKTSSAPFEDTPLLDEEEKTTKNSKPIKMTSTDSSTLYPWSKVGVFHPSGVGAPTSKDSKVIKAYILENFYNDLYYNVATVFGTCFFSWGFAYIGMSWWSIGFIFFCSAAVYNNEYRRFNRNIRDDLQRVTVQETLSERTETTLWLNSFLSKFWVIYMPVLSKQVKESVNPTLAGVAPGYGIDAFSLEEFTLGSKAPAIRGIKTNTKTGKKFVEMDWSFAFTPNDVSDMTPKEVAIKVNPKISLGVTIGKGVVSKTVSVIVENINVAGKLRVGIEFGTIFPNIKIVSIQLLEPPLIDFVLKPVGGDTLGLDIMSFLPGLKSTVKSLIDSNLAPMLYAPNKMDINVEDIMSAQSNDATGVLAVTIHDAAALKSSGFITNTVDPYVTISTENSVKNNEPSVKTKVINDSKSPKWNETHYLTVNSLQQKLFLKCFDFNDVRSDTLIGELEITLEELLQENSLENQSTELLIGTQPKGQLNYSLNWFPCIQKSEDKVAKGTTDDKKKLESTTEQNNQEENDAFDDVDVGIIKFTLQNIKYLDTSGTVTGTLSPSAELYLNNELVKSYRTLRRINEPSWGETTEIFIPSKSNSKIRIDIFDQGMNGKDLICQYNGSLEDILNSLSTGNGFIKGSPQGEIYVDAQWKPVTVSTNFSASTTARDPIGSLKLFVKDANIAGSLAGIGDIDPYFTVAVNRHLKFKSPHFTETRTPIFNREVFIPITSENQNITLSLFDFQGIGGDRFIGQYQITANELIQKDEKTNLFLPVTRAPKLTKIILNDKHNLKTETTVTLTVQFISTVPVYTVEEAEEINLLEDELSEKKRLFQIEQEKLKKEMDMKPSEYELTEIDNPFYAEEKAINKKNKFDLLQLMEFNSGILSLNFISGTLEKSSSYLHVTFDDFAYPSFSSLKSQGTNLVPETGSAFIRDLNNSTAHFIISKKFIVQEASDIISQNTFRTLSLLQSSLSKPLKLKVGSSYITIKSTYNPTAAPLDRSESILDTGYLHLKIISAEGLMSADRNGKSDPFARVFVDGRKAFKTEVVKKTLSPVWNATAKIAVPSRRYSQLVLEVFDWDMAGDNEELGLVGLDIEELEPNREYHWNLPLSTQGTVKVKGKFVPEYIKASLQENASSSGIAAVPLKKIGTSNVLLKSGGNVVNAGVGGLQFGGKMLKKGVGLGGDIVKKTKNENSSHTHEKGHEKDTTKENIDSNHDRPVKPTPRRSLSKKGDDSHKRRSFSFIRDRISSDSKPEKTHERNSSGASEAVSTEAAQSKSKRTSFERPYPHRHASTSRSVHSSQEKAPSSPKVKPPSSPKIKTPSSPKVKTPSSPRMKVPHTKTPQTATQEKDSNQSLKNTAEYDPSIPNQEYVKVPANSLANKPETTDKQSEHANHYHKGNGGVGGATNSGSHQRSVSRASSFARTLAPNGTYEGVVKVIAAEKVAKNVQIKVSLAQGGRMKPLFMTKTLKADDKGVVAFNDEGKFKASPEANLVFGAIAHHKFSKDRDIGVAQINLDDEQIQQENNIAIKLGDGHVVVKVDYGGEALNTPPLPEIPPEHR
ncbi:hypothetical protein TBLA_0E04720 [Henningerozyma blattae CBS 6284]|uniref:Tricalbin n=1 Tax=Henningerozyma blattae (strain ATCC 34711 / CBS 6284 / DSM 70876 / NBRC 10599 / NRRL Y-10934 / UCD 77-7) TaxID=1071380 RepID=I2H572_HENB6|nr:hypothetical protein TBLA_0E04720 [Tetrapisispora blattae CBS 6284]CCH61524.1 hypothetical protein TBLA_0E04720 [Tetrapisispora blattae CBS 6284]